MRVKSMGHHWINLENSIHMMSDHVVLWYDPVSCKQIMDAVEAINDVNSTGYNPKLTFRFFIDESETLYDEMTIKECGFRWIYQEEEEEEETLRPRKKPKQDIFGTPPSLELDSTKDLR
jgi:hypothetical protein